MSMVSIQPRSQIFRALMAVALVVLLVLGSACERTEQSNVSASKQHTIMERATAAVPAYEPNEFPIREAINWYLQETETTDVWYVYLLSMQGRPIWYIVSDIIPMSVCRSITAPDRLQYWNGRALVRAAPSMTATYGSQAECNDYFARDVTTGAFIKFAPGAATWIASSVPLPIETDLGRLGGDQ